MRTTPVSRASILIVDEVRPIWRPLQQVFNEARHLQFATSAAQAFAYCQRRSFHLVCLGASLPDMNGIELLKKLKRATPNVAVILASADRNVQTAVDAMKAGALDFLTAPIDGGHLRAVAAQALARQKTSLRRTSGLGAEDGAGPDDAMHSAWQIIDTLSPIECHVLILGGTGLLKKRIARMVHDRSRRAQGPYVTLNCAGIPSRSLARTLFGSSHAASPSTAAGTPGKIEHAHTGSLFLDNINYLSLDMQAALVQIMEHQPVGPPRPHQTLNADIRILAATSQNLEALVDAGLFRMDLYRKLNALPIDLSLLIAKGDDIGLLLEHFMKQIALRHSVPCRREAKRARYALMANSWPGNVREFEYLLERLCSVPKDGMLKTAHLPEPLAYGHPTAFKGLELKKAIRAFERQHILTVLQAVDGKRSQAARQLGIHRNTLRTKTKELGIDL